MCRCCLRHRKGSDEGEVCPQCPPLCSRDDMNDCCCLARIISICRTHEQAAECDSLSQVNPQRRSRQREKWLLMSCALLFLLAFIFLMGSLGKGGNNTSLVFLPSKSLWLLGCLLLRTLWLLLRLLQMFLWMVEGLLWFISVSASPLCCCMSFLLSCIFLLLHYTCDALFFVTTSPVYIYGMFLSVPISLLIFTRKSKNQTLNPKLE